MALFKKDDMSIVRNYHPVLEHIVCSNITAHLDERELLSDRQHAFRIWHSCETQLTTVINLGQKGQVDTFILDFCKMPSILLPMNNIELAKCFPLLQTNAGSSEWC